MRDEKAVQRTGHAISSWWENRNTDRRNITVSQKKKTTADTQTSQDVRTILLEFEFDTASGVASSGGACLEETDHCIRNWLRHRQKRVPYWIGRWMSHFWRIGFEGKIDLWNAKRNSMLQLIWTFDLSMKGIVWWKTIEMALDASLSPSFLRLLCNTTGMPKKHTYKGRSEKRENGDAETFNAAAAGPTKRTVQIASDGWRDERKEKRLPISTESTLPDAMVTAETGEMKTKKKKSKRKRVKNGKENESPMDSKLMQQSDLNDLCVLINGRKISVKYFGWFYSEEDWKNITLDSVEEYTQW